MRDVHFHYRRFCSLFPSSRSSLRFSHCVDGGRARAGGSSRCWSCDAQSSRAEPQLRSVVHRSSSAGLCRLVYSLHTLHCEKLRNLDNMYNPISNKGVNANYQINFFHSLLCGVG